MKTIEITAKLILFLVMIIFFSCQENKVDNKALTKEPVKENNSVKEEKESKPVKPKAIKSQKEYSLGDLKVKLTQYRNDENGVICKSEIMVSNNGTELDSIEFMSDPVGGNYGISKGTQINNHLIFTKHGDYDGRTLIINENGKIFNIIGGGNYYDKDANKLFTMYESDMPGFAVFDLTSDKMLLEMEGIPVRPMSMHKYIDNRYVMIGSGVEDDVDSIWEFEFDLESIMEVELDKSEINDKNILQYIPSDNVDCICEK